MAKVPQIRGMLLEEAVLYLIAVSGYKAVTYTSNDPTLHIRPTDKALCVCGRRQEHEYQSKFKRTQRSSEKKDRSA